MRVTLKLATSLDGRIATASGESKWITGEAARAAGHRLRAEHDAILVGVETVLADDPELTVRPISAHPRGSGDPVRAVSLAGQGVTGHGSTDNNGAKTWVPASAGMSGINHPLRVVLDSRLRTPATAKVASTNTLILTITEPAPVGGADVQRVEAEDGRPAIPAVLAALESRGVTSLLIEGGGQVSASFLRAGLVDRLEWFRAPILLGGEGRPCVAALELGRLKDAPRFRRLAVEPCGDDLWERYERLS
jgi:diaminohydroxyphosphoribosylaminopyrimidine deaminase/5-amino-6-(5-phosphoribosylamino)uracil reductase